MAVININSVFVSVGRKPSTELMKDQIEIDPAGYIIADESTRTNIPGVFAVGDVRTKALRQVVTASRWGNCCSLCRGIFSRRNVR